jgi:hypothetical protein
MALGLPGDDAFQHIGQVGLRVESLKLSVFTSEARIAQLSAPPSLPLNNELRLPIATRNGDILPRNRLLKVGSTIVSIHAAARRCRLPGASNIAV